METGLSLGSNQGERLANLAKARDCISALPGVTIAAKSPAYETEPVGVRREYQNMMFINALLIVESPWNAHDWFKNLREIEYLMGRSRTIDRYSPRPIDIDIIYNGDAHIESGGLIIPHPHWKERRFVLQPLADVRPDLVLPGTTRTVRELLAELPEKPGVKLLTHDW